MTGDDTGDKNQALMITGLARSGTTWLAKLFDAHPEVIYRHEPDRPPLFPTMPILADADLASTYRMAIEAFHTALPHMDRVLEAGSMPVFRKTGEGHLQFQLRRAATTGARVASRRLGNIRIPFAHRPESPTGAARGKSSPFLVWKSVWSVGRLGCLLSAWPQLRVILLIRNPCGVIESRQRGVAQGRIAAISQAQLDALVAANPMLVEHLRRRHLLKSPIDYSALYWAVMNSHALQVAAENPRCRVIRYEDLTASPNELLSDLFTSCGLGWTPHVERFLAYTRSGASRRYYGLRRTASTTDRWRSLLTPAERDRIYEVVSETGAGRLYASGET